MEEKVKALRIGIIVSIISLIVAIFVDICIVGLFKNILFAVFTGLFVSSMVTVFIYGTEYSVLKKKTLEAYWQTAFDINNRFGSIRVMYFGDSVEEVQERLSALYNTKSGKCLRADYKRDKEFESHIQDYGQIENYRNHAIEVMKDYISVTDMAIQDLENAYGNIYFFWNNKQRDWLYNNIHTPLRNMYRKVKTNVMCHFIPYMNGSHHNLMTMIGIIQKHQNELFEIKTREVQYEGEKQVTLSYYNKFHHNMDEVIEQFRSEIIYHKKMEKCEYEAQMIVTQNWDKNTQQE